MKGVLMQDCIHHRSGARFEPGTCEGNCPVCGAIVGAPPGSPTTSHQAAGSRDTCPGSGSPAV
ncbi:hypothetical protein B7R87_16630 [Streptomyces tsukubensis]|uniref:Uncharacterized protein n=1 Tax=Streptomyces tsukubensis (strain DSM 42081 / NBRC 108919 / NRRL 18488 / 9993) TaxID=1114943 RepID=A0A7G3UDZ7_STRT9|nr:hypothetical protein B7R87_16630 [Streptomyces tsukubensis]QKM68647.1 hypothetical protein STSU_017165 [Streptomyces tsukubensis NRRL18488]